MGQPCSQASWNSHHKNVKITPACWTLRKTRVHVYLSAYKERSPLFPHRRATTRLSSKFFKESRSFSSQHIKQALAKGGAFLPRLPCRFQSDHPFRPHLLFTQSYFFRKCIFPNILLTGPLGLCKFWAREDPATSFPPAGQALLLAPEDSNCVTKQKDTILPGAKC